MYYSHVSLLLQDAYFCPSAHTLTSHLAQILLTHIQLRRILSCKLFGGITAAGAT